MHEKRNAETPKKRQKNSNSSSRPAGPTRSGQTPPGSRAQRTPSRAPRPWESSRPARRRTACLPQEQPRRQRERPRRRARWRGSREAGRTWRRRARRFRGAACPCCREFFLCARTGKERVREKDSVSEGGEKSLFLKLSISFALSLSLLSAPNSAPRHDVLKVLKDPAVVRGLELKVRAVARRRDGGRHARGPEVRDEPRGAGHRARAREERDEDLLAPPHELRGVDAVLGLQVELVDEDLARRERRAALGFEKMRKKKKR